ncbi:MAG: anthrax toxin-like adenylyl cyclase domain-containing protein [Planctomycetota bacterium]
MAASLPRGSVGKGQLFASGSNGTQTVLQNGRTLGRGDPRMEDFPIDLDPTSLHEQACRMRQSCPGNIVEYFENYELLIKCRMEADRLPTRPEFRQIDYLGGPILVLPRNTIFQQISEAFFRGFIAGAQESLKQNPQLLDRLQDKIIKASIINAVFCPIFLAGVVVGLAKEVIDTITGIYGIITNFDEIIASLVKLVEAVLDDPNSAEAFGKVLGIELVKFFDKLSRYNAFRFTFELGVILSPIVIGAVVALTGVGAGMVAATWGARFFRHLVQVLRRFPRVKAAIDGLLELGEQAAKSNRWFRYIADIGQAATKSGMTRPHIRAFRQVAMDENRIIAVRNTNKLSTQWIQRGYPGKPMDIKVKTSNRTGIVTVTPDTDPKHVEKAREFGAYIVDSDNVPRNQFGQALDLPNRTDWPLEPGQVIDPKSKKPFVGDYDLHSVIDPDAPGRNIVLHSANKKQLDNITNPDQQRIAGLINDKLDQPRVLHGAHDGFADLKSAKDGTTIFQPDGRILSFDTVEEMEDYFDFLGRVTIKGSYESGPLPDVLPDNVIPLPGR